MINNICNFLPTQKVYDVINIINFVLECNFANDNTPMRLATYRLFYVLEGEGTFQTSNRTESLKKGDLLLVYPDITFSIDHNSSLKYLYISFIGGKANYIIDKLKLRKPYSLMKEYQKLESIWLSYISASTTFSDIQAEAVLLVSFSEIAKRNFIEENQEKKATPLAQIQKHIDSNICNPSLCLGSIAKSLKYHPKYISALFKKETGIGISKYITTLRVQHACTLIDEGFTSIKNISEICGYKDAFYFSKVFKNTMGISPNKYIEELKKKRHKTSD